MFRSAPVFPLFVLRGIMRAAVVADQHEGSILVVLRRRVKSKSRVLEIGFGGCRRASPGPSLRKKHPGIWIATALHSDAAFKDAPSWLLVSAMRMPQSENGRQLAANFYHAFHVISKFNHKKRRRPPL